MYTVRLHGMESKMAIIRKFETEKDIDRHLGKLIRGMNLLYLKTSFTNADGLPDRLILDDKGTSYFVELKRPGECPRKLQQFWLRRLYKSGFKVFTLDNKRSAEWVALRIGGSRDGIYTSQVSKRSSRTHR